MVTTTAPRPATTARRDAMARRPADVRAPGRTDRQDADDRLDELHHRRLHARRDREDDDLAGS
jgi:hypothetical protein